MTQCPSCGLSMPVERLCENCSTDTGALRDFDEMLERFSQWAIEVDGADPAEARKKSLAYMAQRPAWRDHPALKAARAETS